MKLKFFHKKLPQPGIEHTLSGWEANTLTTTPSGLDEEICQEFMYLYQILSEKGPKKKDFASGHKKGQRLI